MKELTIEEKAKAYDKAVKDIMAMMPNWENLSYNGKTFIQDLVHIIPELAESEDERIRKGLIKAFGSIGKKEWGGINVKNAIAWIEKQGEHANFINKIQIGDKVTRNEDGVLVNLSQLKRVAKKDEKQNEQNPDNIDNKFISMRETKPKDISEFLDRLTTVEQEFLWEHIAKIRKLDKEEQKSTGKVKPRFKFGNWVVIDSEVLYIKEVTEDGYLTDEGGLIPFRCDKEAHLWTIQDAKDGDVIADGNLPFIFKKIDANKYSYAYCGISVDDGFKIKSDGESGEWTWMQDIKPATKEQRNLLFKKMHEAGYEWDAEKKELLKIEQKPAWSEDDENRLNHTIQYLEDKDRWKDTERAFPIEEDVRWLKSLRPQSQWRPSEEMLEALYRAIPENTMAISEDEMLLDKLYQGLKYGRVLSNK